MKHTALVEIHEEKLIEKYLLTPRKHSDRSGIMADPHFRLTSLGYELCQFIEHYDPDGNAKEPKDTKGDHI